MCVQYSHTLYYGGTRLNRLFVIKKNDSLKIIVQEMYMHIILKAVKHYIHNLKIILG